MNTKLINTITDSHEHNSIILGHALHVLWLHVQSCMAKDTVSHNSQFHRSTHHRRIIIIWVCCGLTSILEMWFSLI